MKTQSKPQHTQSFSPKPFLTVTEAGEVLGISRNSAYAAAKRYRQSGGTEGIPNIQIAGTYRVPAAALQRMADIAVPDQLAI